MATITTSPAQPWDATLTSIADLGTASNRMIYTTGVDTWAEVTTTSYGRSLLSAANDVAAQILLGLGTMATQNSNSVSISGGTITGITDLAVADGGTGASTAADARTNLGLVAGGAGDIWFEKAGDTATGTVTIDINSDASAIKIIQNGTQTTFPIQLRNAADSAYTSAIDANGRFRSVAAVSSGIVWMDNTLASTTYLTINHTSTTGSLTNGAGDFNFNGFATGSVFFNSGGVDINHVFRTADDDNALNIDGGLNTLAIGDSPASVKKLTISQSSASTGNPTTLVINGTQTASAATTLKGATFNLFMTHTSGSLSGANVTEFNWTASGSGGTTSTVEGLNFIGNVSAGATVSTANYIHLYAPNNSGTLSTLNAIKADAGHVIFNDNGGDYDFRVEGSGSNANLFMVDASALRVGVNVAAPSAKFHVAQDSTTAAIPVLYLNQADVSEQMIQFETTIGTGNAIEAVGAKVLTTTHFVKVTVPGSLTRYFPVGTIA